MIKLIGWVTVIGLGLYFKIIQAALILMGSAFIFVGGLLGGVTY